MDKSYGLYCFVDPLFYDSPARIDRKDLEYRLGHTPAPDGWMRSELDDWVVYWPHDAEVPPQGWKIHVSSCLDNAEHVLLEVWDYCVSRQIAFKFVRSMHHFFLRNAKYADRGASGKLMAIYPSDVEQLRTILQELGAILAGQPGPYILSDLRWGNGPLYVRYGGIAERYCINARGEAELAIVDPSGKLVPDRRGPTFALPAWEELPDFLVPHLEARKRITLVDLPYRIDRALHFSNGGGLYHAVDERDGSEVVLKEARPHAGLSMDRIDAVTRLKREGDVLERLSGLGVVPELRDRLVLGENQFLVQEYVDARPLTSLIAERYPLTLEDPGVERLSTYASWALQMVKDVERAVAAIHGRGIVIGDVHPSNILVTPDGRVRVVDFEIASDISDPRPPSLADPGFLVPVHLLGVDVDRYALACLRLAIFLPLTELLVIDPAKALEFASVITALFPVPPDFAGDAAAFIVSAALGAASEDGPSNEEGHARRRAGLPSFEPDTSNWPALGGSLAQAILASATPERDDRLFPGDIRQSSLGGLNLAYGAAGVLYALAVTNHSFPEGHLQWLLERAMRPPQGTRLGLYDGLHGVAYALDRLGRRAEALKVVELCTDDVGGTWEQLGLDLFGGLSGIGLTLAHFATVTGDAAIAEASTHIVTVIADRLGNENAVSEVSGGVHPYAGLTRGSAGPALLFLTHYDLTGDSVFLDLAATALRQDLRRCYERPDGSLEVNEGWRTMPYLADGSVGIGMVLDRFLLHRDDERFADASAAISRAARGQFYIEPGLFYGRAGMILYLTRRFRAGEAPGDRVVGAQIRRLAWHALDYRGHLAFPGEQLLRLSMDLGTGNAGILLAIASAMQAEPASLPFLGPVHGLSANGGDSQRVPAARRTGDDVDDRETTGRR